MFDEIHTRGEWWLPAHPNRRIPGSLDFTTREGASLTLSGILGPSRGHHSPDFILGHTLDGEEVTLYGCDRTRTDQLPFAGLSASDYHAPFIFRGSHFDTRDALRLDAVHIHYTNLNEWLRITGFDHAPDEAHDLAIHYKHPDPIVATINQDLSILVGFTLSQGGTLYSIHAEQDAYFSVRGPSSGYEYYEKYVELLQNLLCLACTSPIYPRIIRLSPTPPADQAASDRRHPQMITLCYQIATAPSHITEVPFHQMLFTFDSLKGRFEAFLHNWITKYDILGPVFDLYFGSVNNPYSYTTHKFLNIVQGLESYHRRSFDMRTLPEDEFQQRKQALGEAFPQYRKWLKWKLRYANEPSLEERLIDLGNRYKRSIAPMVGAYDSYFEKVAATRNYLTHFDEESRQQAAFGGELRGMVQTLTAFLETFLLTELGFDYDEVVEMQRHRRRLPYW